MTTNANAPEAWYLLIQDFADDAPDTASGLASGLQKIALEAKDRNGAEREAALRWAEYCAGHPLRTAGSAFYPCHPRLVCAIDLHWPHANFPALTPGIQGGPWNTKVMGGNSLPLPMPAPGPAWSGPFRISVRNVPSAAELAREAGFDTANFTESLIDNVDPTSALSIVDLYLFRLPDGLNPNVALQEIKKAGLEHARINELLEYHILEKPLMPETGRILEFALGSKAANTCVPYLYLFASGFLDVREANLHIPPGTNSEGWCNCFFAAVRRFPT